MKSSDLFYLLPVVVLLFLQAGCSDGRPTRVPVSGRVMIDGKPLNTGYIRLIPSNARPAGSQIGDDGSFTLTTFDEHDGATLGQHTVTVTASESKDNGTVLRFTVPEKYGDASTSDVQIEITEPTESLQIDLSWEGTGRTGPYELRTYSEGDSNPTPVIE